MTASRQQRGNASAPVQDTVCVCTVIWMMPTLSSRVFFVFIKCERTESIQVPSWSDNGVTWCSVFFLFFWLLVGSVYLFNKKQTKKHKKPTANETKTDRSFQSVRWPLMRNEKSGNQRTEENLLLGNVCYRSSPRHTGWEDSVCSHFHTSIHTVVHTSAVLPNTPTAALRRRRVQ